MILPDTFYTRPDVVAIARELLGKVLVTRINGSLTSVMITETEAYAGITDKASHAYGGRYTGRTKIMYAAGGAAYVYLCYGIHHMFNVVTNVAGIPHAVLIRAGSPLEGCDVMLQRRGKNKMSPVVTAGPGAMSMALGIHYSQSGLSLHSQTIYLEDRGIVIAEEDIAAGPRIGVAYAEEDAALPYRFYLRNHAFVSKPH